MVQAPPDVSSQPASDHPIPHRCVVVIPAWNERECVAATVAAWRALGFARVRVVDNGSTDGTAEVARRAGADVVAEPQRGYGAAAWRGLQDLPADIEWVLFSSADGSDALDPEELTAWTAAADGGADMILGDRCSDGRSSSALNPSQRLCTVLFQAVVRVGWGRTFGDVGSLRAVRLAVWPRLRVADRGFGWNVEMQVRAVERRFEIVELPVRFRPRRAGQSKISGNLRGTIKAAAGILRMLWRLWWNRLPAFTDESAAGFAKATPAPVPRGD